LRPGALPLAALRALVPDVVLAVAVIADEAARHSPGQDAIHYAPRAQLLLCERTTALARRDAAIVLRGSGDPARPDAVVLPDDAAAYGRALYATLHALDDAGASVIAVESPPDDEAWLAVTDRLRRAAAK
jgi:L-threonylcarbamoyladenylate synthase